MVQVSINFEKKLLLFYGFVTFCNRNFNIHLFRVQVIILYVYLKIFVVDWYMKKYLMIIGIGQYMDIQVLNFTLKQKKKIFYENN